MFTLQTLFSTFLLLMILLVGNTPAQAVEETVNINKADQYELARKLTGIGPKKSQAIIEYRDEQGYFIAPEELKNVYGIGDKLVARNLEKIMLVDPEDCVDVETEEAESEGEQAEETDQKMSLKEQQACLRALHAEDEEDASDEETEEAEE